MGLFARERCAQGGVQHVLFVGVQAGEEDHVPKVQVES